ncbi:unnamed protein product [Closterium sp. Naga37s-1]|nr:unnamed protein product [Closterium sp. Naga37s-1]
MAHRNIRGPFSPCHPPFSRAHIMSRREAMAAKDAATAVPELGLIDTMLKELAEYPGRSHSSNNEFKELQEVDMTLVQATMHRTLITIRTRYIECGDDFSGGPQQHLGAFLAMLSKSRKVTVDGVDKEGRPRKHSFELHEEALMGYSKTLDDLQSCLDVCRRHAKSTLSHLQSRLGDLDSLNGVRLFMPDTYPDDKERRAEECLEHFETLVDLFHACERANILPGVDKRAAKRELRIFRNSKKRRPIRRREKQMHKPVSAEGKGNVLEDGQEVDTEHGSSSSNESRFSSSSDDDDEEEEG